MPERARERIALAISFARGSNKPLISPSDDCMKARCIVCCENRSTPRLQPRSVRLAKNTASLAGDFIRPQLGWARAQLGRAGEGVALIRQGLAGLAEAGSRVAITAMLTLLAEAQALDGKIDDALSTIEEALQANSRNSFPFRNLAHPGGPKAPNGLTEMAEADFREAIALVQKMQAKAWELRATMSLARLLASQGRRNEARTLLADIYNWFSEGFDTLDLKEAKALINELNTL